MIYPLFLLQHSQHYIRAHSQNPSQPSGSTVGNSPPLASAPHSALHQTSPPTPYAKVESVGQNLPSSQDVQNPSLTPLQSTNVPRVQLSGSGAVEILRDFCEPTQWSLVHYDSDRFRCCCM
jgi:hypothetical protein